MHRDYIKNKGHMNSVTASSKNQIKTNVETNVCNFDFVKLFVRPFSWCIDIVVIIIVQLHSPESELKLCVALKSARGVSEICKLQNL